MNMKKFLLSILCCLMAVVSGYAEEATLSFANKAQRTSYSTAKQVWEQNGITFTNNKSSSTTNVADYASPVRLYQNSEIIVECALGNITQIVFDCNTSNYATALKNSIGSTAATSVVSDKVTVTLDGSSNSITIAKLTAQVRMDALTVTYSAGVGKPLTPTLTAGGNFVGSMEVEISCATDDADIYYTTDGTEPTEDSEPYSEAFDITETTTVKAIAVNEAGASNVATAVYTRVAATPVIYFENATFEESVAVTITAGEGTTAYYTLNGKTPNEDSDECPETLTLKADATLQVIAYDEDGYASPVVKQAFKKSASDAAGGTPTGTATLVTDVADLAVGDKVVIVATNYDVALSTTQNNNNRGQAEITKNGNDVTLNENVQILTLENGTVDGTFAFNTGSGYLYAASSGSNHLKTQTTNNANGSWKIDIDEGVATVKAQGTNTRNWLRYNSATNNGKIFSCYGSGQTDVSLYKVNLASIEDYVLNVSAAGWATLFLGYSVTIPDDVNCYVISEFGDGTVALEQVTGVLPANTGVIVEATAGEYAFEVTDATADIESNLSGSVNNEYVAKEAYVLSIVDDKVGLFKAELVGGVFLNNANKAYLPASAVPDAVQGASGFKFRFETTGVEQVEVAKGVKAIYDLSGRKVNDMKAPGLYIVNGKKVLVK